MALWTPEELGANLKAWYKADAITGLADTDPVASWVDSSGNGHTLVQATGGVQPTYDAVDQNGLPVVDFASASSQRLEIASSLGISAQPFYWFGVWFMANSGSQCLFQWEGGASADGTVNINAGGNLEMHAGAALAGAITKAAWRMTANGFNGASSWFAIDGATRTSGNAGTAAPNGTKTVVGAAVAEASFFVNGSIAEIVILDTAPIQSDEDKLFGYAGHKWDLDANLPSGHPYKNAAPILGAHTGLRYPLGSGLRQRTLRP